MALQSEDKNPPLCMIITEEFITILLLFPFTKDGIDLIKCHRVITAMFEAKF